MSRARPDVPTLTEAIHLSEEPVPLDAPTTEAYALEDLPLAELLALLQPPLEAWVDARVRAALAGVMPAWTDSAVQAVRSELRTALPAMVAQALDNARPGGKKKR